MLLDVLVVGGGLSGMVVARSLTKHPSSCQWKLLEARSILGGRLANDKVHNEIDLGGAWVWPEFQPKMSRLIKSLPTIETFLQPDDPSSTRIVGGAIKLVDQLAAQVPSGNILLNSPVVSCFLKSSNNNNNKHENDHDQETCATTSEYVEIKTANQEIFQAKRVVFAVPPKLLTKHIAFDPPLNPEKWRAMVASETWMAGVTKIALEYPKRFWPLSYSNMGLPTSAGPAFQVYDSSTEDSKIASLTFFTLIPSNSPAYSDGIILAQMVAQQMGMVWKAMEQESLANQVPSYTNYHVHRWPIETYISEDDKPIRINPHPHPVHHLATNDWNDRLLFAGSEADLQSSGVMEGAVGAAERVLNELEPMLTARKLEEKIQAQSS